MQNIRCKCVAFPLSSIHDCLSHSMEMHIYPFKCERMKLKSHNALGSDRFGLAQMNVHHISAQHTHQLHTTLGLVARSFISFHFIHSMRLQIKWIVRKSSMHCNENYIPGEIIQEREEKKRAHITFYYMNNKSDRWHNHNLLLIFIKFSSSKRIVICGTPDEKPSNCIE